MTVFAGVLIALGCGLILTGGIGLLRFPDLLTRANATGKAAGLGLACVLLGVAAYFNTTEAWVKMSLAIALQFATAPVSAHVIARAAYRSGAPLWVGTHIDDLAAYQKRQLEDFPEAGERDRPREGTPGN